MLGSYNNSSDNDIRRIQLTKSFGGLRTSFTKGAPGFSRGDSDGTTSSHYEPVNKSAFSPMNGDMNSSPTILYSYNSSEND